jgi:hypothetical protein
MRGLLVMGIPYQHAPEVSIVRTDTCTCRHLHLHDTCMALRADLDAGDGRGSSAPKRHQSRL